MNFLEMSKLISRLKERLQTRLFNRSTRQLDLTEEGRIFYEECVKALDQLALAECSVLSAKEPSGFIRVSSNLPLAHGFLFPILSGFLKRYPKINLDFVLSDEVVNLIEQDADVAIRSGPMKSSDLMARKLLSASLVLVASPRYLKERGQPKSVEELREHECLSFTFQRQQKCWNFKEGSHRPRSHLRVNNGASLRHLALEGCGIAQLSTLQIEDDLRVGRLIRILPEQYLPVEESTYAVFLGHGGYLPQRIWVFLDYLVEHVAQSVTSLI